MTTTTTTPDALPPLVERLRDAVTQQRRSLYGPCDCMPLMDEAAEAIERLTAERDAALGDARRLRSALERLRGIAWKPCRDVTETLAEVDAALAAQKGDDHE